MIRRIFSGEPWEDVAGHARAVVAGPWVLVAGRTATVGGDAYERTEVDAYVSAAPGPREGIA